MAAFAAGQSLDSPRASDGKTNRHHRRRRVHRHDARAPARRRERDRCARQPPSRLARRHTARGASELHLRPGRRARLRAPHGADGRRHACRPLRGDRRCRHRPREPGAHDAGQRRGDVQRPRGRAGDEPDARAVRRLLDERGLRPARVQRAGGARDDDRLGRRGALDLRGVEARGRAHGARVLRRARAAHDLGAPIQRLRAGSDRRRSDPGVHRDRRSPGRTSRSTATARRSAPGAT